MLKCKPFPWAARLVILIFRPSARVDSVRFNVASVWFYIQFGHDIRIKQNQCRHVSFESISDFLYSACLIRPPAEGM